MEADYFVCEISRYLPCVAMRHALPRQDTSAPECDAGSRRASCRSSLQATGEGSQCELGRLARNGDGKLVGLQSKSGVRRVRHAVTQLIDELLGASSD
jgi:hypothetical protein